ncbi:hypothetical protein ACFL2D_02970 [Patescibacteria group bacterium]
MKKSKWQQQLKYDPIPALLEAPYKAVVYFTKKDLVGEKVPAVSSLWQLPEVEKILRGQKKNGGWKYPGANKTIRDQRMYNFLETYRQLGFLVQKYGMTKKHASLRKAAEYLFGFQTKAGDFRGLYWRQYSPNYSAQVCEQLIRAGYEKDRRVLKCLDWLLTMRQDDGGWALSVRTHPQSNIGDWMKSTKPLEPKREKPFSHFVTGIVIRPFSLLPQYRRRPEVVAAGELLKSRFFQSDKYPDRRTADFWEKLGYPYWQCDYLPVMDALQRIGFSKDDAEIKKVLEWFYKRQRADGIWKSQFKSGTRPDTDYWVSLDFCRILKRWK